MLAMLQFVLSRFFAFYLRVMSGTNFPPPLSAEEEEVLFLKMREGSGDARNALIEHNLRLVIHIVKKYYASAREAEDLVSIGTVGLIKAIDTFNPALGARFATYGAKCVQNEILMHFRAGKKLACETSLSEATHYDRDGNALTYLDLAGEDEDFSELLHRKERALATQAAVKRLKNTREREIVVLRYGLCGGEPLTQRAVAKKLGISRSYVSRLEKEALTKIRADLKGRRAFRES